MDRFLTHLESRGIRALLSCLLVMGEGQDTGHNVERAPPSLTTAVSRIHDCPAHCPSGPWGERPSLLPSQSLPPCLIITRVCAHACWACASSLRTGCTKV